MAKITKAHIRAARVRKKLLTGQSKQVPSKIEKLANLDISKYPTSVSEEKVSPQSAQITTKRGLFSAALMKHGLRMPKTMLIHIDDEGSTKVPEPEGVLIVEGSPGAGRTAHASWRGTSRLSETR